MSWCRQVVFCLSGRSYHLSVNVIKKLIILMLLYKIEPQSKVVFSIKLNAQEQLLGRRWWVFTVTPKSRLFQSSSNHRLSSHRPALWWWNVADNQRNNIGPGEPSRRRLKFDDFMNLVFILYLSEWFKAEWTVARSAMSKISSSFALVNAYCKVLRNYLNTRITIITFQSWSNNLLD